MLPIFSRTFFVLPIVTMLCSCGGSSDDGISGIDGSGAPVTTAVAGPINGFGSVILDGVHYNTQNTVIMVNGKPGVEADLSVGSYIVLQGEISADGKEGVATRIDFQSNVAGTIDSINPSTESFVVLGQTVRVSDDTSFDFAISPRNITGLTAGQNVEVSGPLNADGQIVATRIGLIVNKPIEMVGTLHKLNTLAQTFYINDQLVNYAGVTPLPKMMDGQDIIIHNAQLVGSELRPQQLELPDVSSLSQVHTLVKTGLITEFVTLTDFYVGSLPVTTDANTQFLNTSPSALAQDVKITLSGHMVGTKLLADKIQWLASAQWQLVGAITQIELTSQGGRIQVENNWITLSSSTRLDSEFAEADNRMKMTNLHVGDYVVLTGSTPQTGEWIASSLEREETLVPQMPKQVRGTVAETNQVLGTFNLLMYKILTDRNTQYWSGFKPISAQSFYSEARNKVVEVRGILEGTKLKASYVKIVPQFYGSPLPSPTRETSLGSKK